MNYIVLDLEWNQSPSGKENSVEKLPFEIIEIGAVKLDEQLNIVDRFDGLIKPQVYKEIHSIIVELTRFSMKELNTKGRLFEAVIQEFFSWCGDEYVFCTWGSQDLTELQRNIQYFKLDYTFAFPLKYLDIQKIFSIRYEDGKSRRSLENAVEFLDIEKDVEFHHAIVDVEYTAKIMKEIGCEHIQDNYSIDLYRKPLSKREEIHVVYDTYSKYISRLFANKEKALADREVRSTRCYLCEQEDKAGARNVTRIANWFSDNARTYYFLGECEQHGFLKGKIKMKKSDDDRVYVVKVLKLTDSEGATAIMEKQLAIREKRRRKRLNGGIN